jgi:hypothetical protein
VGHFLKEKIMEYDEDIVEFLEPVGSPLGIKTIAQGRNKPIGNIRGAQRTIAQSEAVELRRLREYEVLRLTASTILRHELATPREKELAKLVVACEVNFESRKAAIHGIAKRLNKYSQKNY